MAFVVVVVDVVSPFVSRRLASSYVVIVVNDKGAKTRERHSVNETRNNKTIYFVSKKFFFVGEGKNEIKKAKGAEQGI